MPLHGKEPGERAQDLLSIRPQFALLAEVADVPRFRMPRTGLPPDTAYQVVHDELLLDGSARLNLATFVTTWMEPQAAKLMEECSSKNLIDKDEYPQTAELERRCVNILADLWHATSAEQATGCSTTGSSEGCMLGGLALLWRWRQRRQQAGATADRPNLVMGANVQVCWEKFCRYWDVEARLVPVGSRATHLTAEGAVAHCDENTIGVVAVLGSTYDGTYEPVSDIAAALDPWLRRGTPTFPCTSTPPPADSSPHSWIPTWCGTSESRGSHRSTCPVTSSGSSIRESAGWCGETARPFPKTWCSGSTT